jgi:hypothetical protein
VRDWEACNKNERGRERKLGWCEEGEGEGVEGGVDKEGGIKLLEAVGRHDTVIISALGLYTDLCSSKSIVIGFSVPSALD